MSERKNPFNTIFGQIPHSYISRSVNTDKLLNDFKTSGHSEISIITGVRGSGKTVLLTTLAKTLSEEKDWIVVNLNSDMSIYNNACDKLSKGLGIKKRKTSVEVSLLGMNATVETQDAAYSALESELEDLLEVAKKKNKKVLFTFDEITNKSEVRMFLASFQLFIREDLPVYFLASGLANNIYDLQESDTLTFLYRAPKIYLEPLNMASIRVQYKKLLDIDDKTAVKMAKLTKGYSYGYQLLGSLVWDNKGKLDDNVIEQYDIQLANYCYDKIYSELSDKDIMYLEEICENDYTSVNALTSGMGVTTKEFSPYRDRLIKKGILVSQKRGAFDVTLPRLKEYMNNRKLFG